MSLPPPPLILLDSTCKCLPVRTAISGTVPVQSLRETASHFPTANFLLQAREAVCKMRAAYMLRAQLIHSFNTCTAAANLSFGHVFKCEKIAINAIRFY